MRVLILMYGTLRETSQPTFSAEWISEKSKRTVVRATRERYNGASATDLAMKYFQFGEAERYIQRFAYTFRFVT